MGALLREMRLELGMRQFDVAVGLSRPQSFVSKHESGERALDVMEIRLICLELGADLHEFARRLESRLAGRPRPQLPVGRET